MTCTALLVIYTASFAHARFSLHRVGLALSPSIQNPPGEDDASCCRGNLWHNHPLTCLGRDVLRVFVLAVLHC
jgi:hypothetical protein